MAAARFSWVAVLAVGAVLVPAPSAFGHAAFVGSDPAPGVRLERAPQRVVLTFTEPLNRRLSRATLLAANGREVAVAAEAASDRRILLRPARSLGTGAYRVRWHTVSTEDGHALEGSFSFGVRAAAAGGEHDVEQSPLARAGWVRVALRALLYVAVLLFAAGLLLPALVRVRPSWLAPAALHGEGIDVAAIRARERHVIADLGWLAVAAAVGATLAEAADAAGGLSAGGVRDFLLSGSAGASRVAALVTLVAAAAAVARWPRLAAAAAALALWGIAASGHASSATPRAPSILNDWLHLLSGAVWLGGIGLLVLVWTPALRSGGRPVRQAVARHVLPGFGRVALPAFLVVAATGIVSLITQLGHLDALWTTAYGRVLLVKIGLVGLVALASAAHAWRLRPRLLREREPRASLDRRHWRLVRAEPVLGLGVIAAVAVLVAFPLPPRQLADADEEAIAAAAPCDPCPLPKPAADELPVAERAGSQLVAGWLRRDGGQVTGTVRVVDIQGQPARGPFEVLDARQSACGPGCRRFALPAADVVRVAVRDRGRRFIARLPATWQPNAARRARRLLARAQRTMRALRSLREVEQVTSGPGSYARTDYRLRAPNRMAYTTSGGARSVIVGQRQWFSNADTPWARSSYGSGIPFSLARWFRWTTYATAVRLLRRGRERGRPVSELALMDPATPVWIRLVVDERTGRVVRERMVSKAHFTRARYFAFNSPLSIEAPRVG
jgi:copper transport protein